MELLKCFVDVGSKTEVSHLYSRGWIGRVSSLIFLRGRAAFPCRVVLSLIFRSFGGKWCDCFYQIAITVVPSIEISRIGEEWNSNGRQMAVAIGNGNRVYLIVECLAKKFDLLFSGEVDQSRGYLKKGKTNELDRCGKITRFLKVNFNYVVHSTPYFCARIFGKLNSE